MWTHIPIILLRLWGLTFVGSGKKPGMVVKDGQKNFKHFSMARYYPLLFLVPKPCTFNRMGKFEFI